jgi:hypothetical protein
MPLKIIIIGAGTYGSYLAHCIAGQNPDADIHMFEVGDSRTKSEKEIGFLSKVKGLYTASSDGRFFGLGGTSAKWGGQLLFFSPKDFADDEPMKAVVDCNLQYRDKVLSRFFTEVPKLEEKPFNNEFYIKQGIWLKFNQRNVFTHFQLQNNKNIQVHQNGRVVKLNVDQDKITSIDVQQSGSNEVINHTADVFYLATGAFESIRLLHVSGIIDMPASSKGFADHISLRCFKVHAQSGKVGAQDFQFRFVNGSMVTSRLIGEINNTSYFVHAIFNEDFQIFQFLKQMIFKGKISLKKLGASGKQFFFLFPFIYSYLVKKKLYIYGDWYINVDIEVKNTDNNISLSSEVDSYGQNGISIRYEVNQDIIDTMLQIKERVKKILIESDIKFSEMPQANVSSLKIEDTYHPYGLYNYPDHKTIFDVYNPVSNLFLFNTGLLHRAGGLNPTSALFCLIEHHMEHPFPKFTQNS